MDSQANKDRTDEGASGPRHTVQSSPGLSQPRRFDGMFSLKRRKMDIDIQLTSSESWVELSSQPSSSSLSSVGEDIVTTGLQVGGPYHRRRRVQSAARSVPLQRSMTRTADLSSQDEEEESESDDDHVLSSSAENMRVSGQDVVDSSDADSDDGDNATTLGMAPDPSVFRPQPNAFSHPLGQRSMSHNAAYPPHPHDEVRRSSFSHRQQQGRVYRGGPNFMSTSAREDNDAALRASLTTLLSCAAAARGLPKTEEEAARHRNARGAVRPSNQPMELHLVQESELMTETNKAKTTSTQPRQTFTGPARFGTQTPESPKRSSSAGRSPRMPKKKRTATAATPDETTLVSPTVLTWVVSAGVVVLVSVVGFGAGYIIGREVGRQEAQDAFAASVGGVNDTAGHEVMRSSGSGLRRLKWGSVGRSIVAQG